MGAKQGVGDGTGMGSAPEKDGLSGFQDATPESRRAVRFQPRRPRPGTAAEDVERIGLAEGLTPRLRAP